ncbi:MAG: dTMP kinase [Clostridia bacterium]|nr:dTMP kinase [Clostridia bacterium]
MSRFPYDAVVFDLDGTLCDAEEGIISSVKYAMEQLGCPIPEEADLRLVVGPPLRDSFRNLLKVPAELVEKAMDLYRMDFNTRGRFLYSVYPGIRTLLRLLRSEGVHTAVATSKPYQLAKDILDYFGLTPLFTVVMGEVEGADKLGKPELIRRALPAQYQKAAMVGDRKFDVEGAKAAGIDSVGVAYGCGSVEELHDAGAVHIAQTTEALRELLCPGADMPRGFFLTVEGPDGSGKTTQVDRLENNLRKFGFTVRRTREPGGCAISEAIRGIILDTKNMEMCDTCEALLYAAARAQHVHQIIRPAVANGELVLCDRFVDSSVAYQGGGRELGVATIQQINAPAVDGMLPDATLYLAIDHREALSRRLAASTPDRLELQAVSFHGRVQAAYEQLISEDENRFLVVNAAQDRDSVEKDALQAVIDRISAYELR